MDGTFLSALNEAQRRAAAMQRDYRVFRKGTAVMVRPTSDPFTGEPLCIVRQTGTIQWQSEEARELAEGDE